MSWDPLQRAVLEELGHVLYRSASAPGACQVDEAMLARLARAAARPPGELLQHPEIMAAIDGLHGDAGAKRALWPRLRALRR